MKTRVIRVFDTRNAMYVYWVQKWSLWGDPELRTLYTATTMEWHSVRPYLDEETAIGTAQRLATAPADSPLHTVDIIAEFGTQTDV